MPNYLSYFIISFITSSLSTSYINTLYQKNIKSITDELNLQFEENRKLKDKINVTPTIETVLKDIDQCLITLIEKIDEIKITTIEEKTIEKINFTCDKILNTMKNERINSTDSFESFDKLSD